MSEGCNEVFLALQRFVHLANFSLYRSSHSVKTAAQYTDLIVGLHLGTFSILPGSNLLTGRLQGGQRPGDEAAEENCRRAAQRQQSS